MYIYIYKTTANIILDGEPFNTFPLTQGVSKGDYIVTFIRYFTEVLTSMRKKN